MSNRIYSPDVEVTTIEDNRKIQDVLIKVHPTLNIVYEADCLQWIVNMWELGNTKQHQARFTSVIDAINWASKILEER